MDLTPAHGGSGTIGPTDGYYLNSYHFVMQTSNGGWAHKRNEEKASENLGFVNPDSAYLCWQDLSQTAVTPTIYFAAQVW